MAKDCKAENSARPKSIELPVLSPAGGTLAGVQKSRTAPWRAAVLVTVNLLMIAHLVQWWLTGRTVSPIEPSEAMSTIQSGAVNAGFIFFLLAILSTLIFGRFVCGWACHIVALQDFCAWLLKKIGLKPRPFRSRLLVYVPAIVAIYMFVWPTVYRYFFAQANVPAFPGFTNHLITEDFWATFPPVGVAIPFLLICGFLTVYFLGSKGFCTYACPYGGVFGFADKVAPGRIRVTDACNQCGHCTATCTSNVIVHAEVKEHGMVVDPGCMKCMDCVSVCPTDALYFGFGKASVSAPGSVPRSYSISWPEEAAAAIIYFLSFVAVWDVYQLVPMLMALGVATVTTYLAMISWRLLTSKDLTFYKFHLRESGSIRTAGFVFLTAAFGWFALNAHSGWVRYHESAGTRAYERIRVPDELALAQADPRRWLSKNELADVESGRRHLSEAMKYGLFVNRAALPKLAWMEFLSGNPERSVELLSSAAAYQHGQAKALSLYYRGSILNRTGKYDEAVESLDHALEERPDLISARVEKGETLWLMGKKDEAVAVWKETVGISGRIALANFFLAGAAEASGDAAAAGEYEQKGDEVTPADPYFHWMVGLRLRNLGMAALADKQFQKAVRLNPRVRMPAGQ